MVRRKRGKDFSRAVGRRNAKNDSRGDAQEPSIRQLLGHKVREPKEVRGRRS